MVGDDRHDDQVPVRSAALVAVVFLLAVVGAILWFTRDGDADPAPTAAPTVSEPSGTVAPSTPGRATEPLTELDPSEVIPGWSSVEVAGITLPVSTEAGPHDLSDGRARDFERSELGVAMAAVHLLSRTSGYATPAVYEPTIAEQVVEGEDQQRLLSAAAASYEEAVREQGRDDPEGAGMLRGYHVQTYDEELATVEVWTEAAGPNGRVRVGGTVYLRWSDAAGWRLVPPPDGEWDSQVRELVSTEQFVEFPPEVR